MSLLPSTWPERSELAGECELAEAAGMAALLRAACRDVDRIIEHGFGEQCQLAWAILLRELDDRLGSQFPAAKKPGGRS